MQIYMKRIMIFTAALILAVGMHCIISAREEERLADMNKILTAYGCVKNGKFIFGAYVVTKVSLVGNIDDISQIEGMKDLLDTPEEFITASYYSHANVIKEVHEILQKELPPGKIGGLRLASMWLKKSAEERENHEKYTTAINIIKEKSGISDREINSYFNKAIENEINKIADENLGAQYPQKFIYAEIAAPVVNYYREPSKKNEDDLIRAGIKLFDENKSKADGFINTLIKLNDKFAIMIVNKIHEKRANKPK